MLFDNRLLIQQYKKYYAIVKQYDDNYNLINFLKKCLREFKIKDERNLIDLR